MITLTYVLDIIKTITSFAAVAALVFTAMQLKISRSTILLNSIKGIHDENARVRRNIQEAIRQRDELIIMLKDSDIKKDDIYYTYSDKKYESLRELGYHYEYIGIIVKSKVLSFNTLFNLIPFPDKFWKDSEPFITLMRNNYTNDFWINFEYLHKRYEKERKN